MKLDGQLEAAQLEELSSASPSPSPRSRIYSDITNTAKPLPRFYNGSKYVALMTENRDWNFISATHSLVETERQLFCDGTGGGFTVTLMDATTVPNECFYIKKTDSTFAPIALQTVGGQVFDGSGTLTRLSSRGEWILLQSDGANWRTLESGYYSGRTAFTPTGSWITNSTYTGFWWRDGSSMGMDITINLTGAPTSAALTLTLPGGSSIDPNQRTSPTLSSLFPSAILLSDTDGGSWQGHIYFSSATIVGVVQDAGAGTFTVVDATHPFTWANTDSVMLQVMGMPMLNWRG